MSSGTVERPPRTGKGSRRGAVILAAALSIVVLISIGTGWDMLTRRENYEGKKGDYYSSLVHGFLSGHLYMDIAPDPLLASPDPKVVAAARQVLDASYFKGHFYLSYGVVPVVLILLPYSWLTGGDLAPEYVVDLCIVIGFLFSLAAWRTAARERAADMGIAFQVAAVLALAFATATPLLLSRSMFYEIAVASGYACTMAGAYYLLRALSGRGTATVQIACASLSLGLAVGCRPDLLLILPAVAAVAGVLAWRAGKRPTRWVLALHSAAAVLPAALVGIALGIYNFERFGSPFDFGFVHGQNEFFASHDTLVHAAFFWPNLRWDYFTFPAFSPYFPFVLPEAASYRPAGYHGAEAIHGQFPVMLFVGFVFLSSVLFWRRLDFGPIRRCLGVLLWIFAAPFAALSVLGIRADRYMVDFQPALILGMVILGGAIMEGLRSSGWRRPWVVVFAALSVCVAAFNLCAGLQQFNEFKNRRSQTYAALERIANIPSFWLEKLGFLPVGPLELKVIFPTKVPTSLYEPLVSLGTAGMSDSVYVIVHEGGQQVEFMDNHDGFGGRRSKAYTILPGHTYTVRIDMGAFYPPLNHPFFKGYSTAQARLMKTRLHVEMDGAVVRDDAMNAYDAPPWTLETGRNDITLTLLGTAFSGHIVESRRLPLPAPAALHANNGLWRIRCAVPTNLVNWRLPLLSIGLSGSGTLIFVTVLPNDMVTFGGDEWGLGGAISAPLRVNGSTEHLLEVFIGPLAKAAPWPSKWAVTPQELARQGRTLRLWMDGKPVWEGTAHREYDAGDSLIDVGGNLQGFSSTVPAYYGPISPDPFTPQESREFLQRNLDISP